MITDLEEETQDFDWFSVDGNGEIAHFASGGRGFLPPSVRASRPNLMQLAIYFQENLAANGCGVESATLSSHIQFKSDAEKETYLTDFSKMGAKGMYSFDCTLSANRPTNYFLVLKPHLPLKVHDLPADIQKILNLTRFRGTFCTVDVVNEIEVA